MRGVVYGPVRDGYLGPYREKYVPIGEPHRVDSESEGFVGWQVWEMRREYVARYEVAILEPEEEVFGE